MSMNFIGPICVLGLYMTKDVCTGFTANIHIISLLQFSKTTIFSQHLLYTTDVTLWRYDTVCCPIQI